MITTLTGPTCAGKTTIERELQRLGFGRAISHTTRQPRPGEKHGHDYFFVSDATYDELEAAGEFIETVKLGTRRYAMSKMALKQAQDISLNVAIVVDPHGAAQIRAHCEREDMPVYSVWVDCGAAEQARRFTQRMILEQQQGKPNVAGVYAERLQMMLDTEVVWRHNAERWLIDGEGAKYDKQINSSEKKTPKELAATILFSLPSFEIPKILPKHLG